MCYYNIKNMFSLKKGMTIALCAEQNKLIKLDKKFDINSVKNNKNIHVSNKDPSYNMLQLIEANKKGYYKSLELSEGQLQQVPHVEKNQREVCFITGPSGSGKSTHIVKYAKLYKKLFPDNDIIVFSKIEHDEIDELNPIRIKLNEELIDEPVDSKELKNSLVIFDDIDTIKDKHVREAVMDIRDDLLQVGRHDDIYVCTVSHIITDGPNTRVCLSESNCVTFFPSSGSVYHIVQFLKKYCGLSGKQTDEVLNLKSRWVTIYRRSPQYILYEKGCYLLK